MLDDDKASGTPTGSREVNREVHKCYRPVEAWRFMGVGQLESVAAIVKILSLCTR